MRSGVAKSEEFSPLRCLTFASHQSADVILGVVSEVHSKSSPHGVGDFPREPSVYAGTAVLRLMGPGACSVQGI